VELEPVELEPVELEPVELEPVELEPVELEPVERSDWAGPIVVVHKKDGGIRICADFKMTVNPHLQVKTFPLPTTDEVLA